jgi:hypothetical protein
MEFPNGIGCLEKVLVHDTKVLKIAVKYLKSIITLFLDISAPPTSPIHVGTC